MSTISPDAIHAAIGRLHHAGRDRSGRFAFVPTRDLVALLGAYSTACAEHRHDEAYIEELETTVTSLRHDALVDAGQPGGRRDLA